MIKNYAVIFSGVTRIYLRGVLKGQVPARGRVREGVCFVCSKAFREIWVMKPRGFTCTVQ